MSTFGDRLKAAMKNAAVTQQELAEKIGITQQSVQYLCSGKAKTSRQIDRIASELGVAPEWLVFGTNETPDSPYSVPLFSIEQVNNNSATTKTVICPFEHGPGTFAVTVEGTAMSATYSVSQTYPDGCIIFIDPTLASKVEHMDVVAATLPDSKDAFTFRRLQFEAGQSYLVPINPQFPPMLDRPFNIIGKVIGGLLPH